MHLSSDLDPQLSLLPTLAGPVVTLENLSGGVSRAVFAPVIAWDTSRASASVHFIVVGSDAMTVARGDISHSKLDDLEHLGRYLEDALQQERDAVARSAKGPSIPPDSMGGLLSIRQWGVDVTENTSISRAITVAAKTLAVEIAKAQSSPVDMLAIEAAASQSLVAKVLEGIHWALKALHPKALAIMTDRRGLGLGTIRSLINLAIAHGSANAQRFAWQSLSTEALGLCNLLIDGPEEVASALRSTLFNGESLPKALRSIGICRRGHRSSLRRERCGRSAGTSHSELGISGAEFMHLQELLAVWPISRWPVSDEEWQEFKRFSEFFANAENKDNVAILDALIWSWSAGNGGSARMNKLLGSASNLCQLMERFDLRVPSLDLVLRTLMRSVPNVATLTAVEFVESFTFSVGQTLGIVSSLTHVGIEDLSAALWAHLPRFLPAPGDIPFTFSSIRSLHDATRHGGLVGNCLERKEVVIDYCCDCVLFKVAVDGRAIGTLAVGVELSEGAQETEFEIHDLSGLGNIPVDSSIFNAAHTFVTTLRFYEPFRVWNRHLNGRSEFLTKMNLTGKRDRLPLQAKEIARFL